MGIVIPSGVDAAKLKVRVREDGDVLELKENYTKALIDIAFINRNWPQNYNQQFPDFHLKVLGVETSLHKRLPNVSGNISSTSRISLPFSV